MDASPGLPYRPSVRPTPAATERANSWRKTPYGRQQLGDGFQRRVPHRIGSDSPLNPMWNSLPEIQLYERLATTQTPPPPYVLPPAYAEVFSPSGQIEAASSKWWWSTLSCPSCQEPSTLKSSTFRQPPCASPKSHCCLSEDEVDEVFDSGDV